MNPPDLTGHQIAFTVRNGHGPEICIYGDPEGLRSLAKLILFVADVDQSKEPYPSDDSFHLHAGLCDKVPGHPQRITIGRMDSKEGKLRTDLRPW